jgi:hypothetical protein
MKRPEGVTILAILSFLCAGCTALIALVLMFGGAFLAQMSRSRLDGRVLAGFGVVARVLIFAFAVLYAVVGFGLWKLQNWSRLLTMILVGVDGVFSVFRIMNSALHFRPGFAFVNIMICAIDILIFTYLLKPHVKQAFGG